MRGESERDSGFWAGFGTGCGNGAGVVDEALTIRRLSATLVVIAGETAYVSAHTPDWAGREIMKSNTTNGSLLGVLGHRLHSAAGLALLLSACGAPVDADQNLEPTATQSSELKNGFLVDTSVRWRGVVSVRVLVPATGEWEYCSGIVTSRRTMVTAAHCVLIGLPSPSRSGAITALILRENSGHTFDTIMSQGTAYGVVNPAYTGLATNDVAVIRSTSDFTNVYSTDANPIAKVPAPANSTLWAMGYGFFNDQDTDWDGHLRGGKIVPVFGSASNEYRYDAPNSSAPELCLGDSGGPIKMVYGGWLTFGIESHLGTTGSKCSMTAYWAPTSANWSWIESIIGPSNCAETPTNLTCW